MHIIIGLGNPGLEYRHTRHNAGFLALDHLAGRYGFDPPTHFKNSLVSKGRLEGERVVLAWPQTYMNLSGQAALELASFYKVPGENILVMHDEMDLPAGRLKMSFGGGTAGHKGLVSILAMLREDFCRLKIGISRPPREIFTAGNIDYVLGRFLDMEQPLIEEALDMAAEAAGLWVLEGLAKAQLKVNRRPKKPKKAETEEPGEGAPAADKSEAGQ
ncbi:aminoacyl-tRNA hydrolase [Deltaproteobacteria bacterium OttesenSCG-928-M10]|nr:aminoacyl-tRNA hydrolase [Deltaproteobacteria bacterium OttesenSCG-928-M10]